VNAFNPVGCIVQSFKVPTPEELSYDFLWRVHKVVPRNGFVGVFNRSHYEDVVAVRVHHLIPKSMCFKRFNQIKQFEIMLTENKVRILKFFLHISKQEQKKRLADRLSDPENDGNATKKILKSEKNGESLCARMLTQLATVAWNNSLVCNSSQ
jgi:polyphosphate kinase 2 (PPK2 family)